MSIKQLITADELWAMPEVPGMRLEMVEGELREVPGAGAVHALIVALVHELMRNFVRQHKLGRAFPDGLSYVLRRNPDSVRIPDVSFVARDRIPEAGIPEGFWEGAPTLAVEVVSPEDRAVELYAKAREYLEAGTREVWILWPRHRSVTVHSAGGSTKELGPDDELTGGDILPGFRARVGGLFDIDE